jgi:twitching motility protein PilI
VPLTRAWYAGVANVRGNLYSVVDFSAFLGGARTVRSEASRLLLISDKYRVGCALLIDAVVGLRNPQLFVLATDNSDSNPWVAAHYTDRDKQQWADLAVERLVQHPDFLDIGARSS